MPRHKITERSSSPAWHRRLRKYRSEAMFALASPLGLSNLQLQRHTSRLASHHGSQVSAEAALALSSRRGQSMSNQDQTWRPCLLSGCRARFLGTKANHMYCSSEHRIEAMKAIPGAQGWGSSSRATPAADKRTSPLASTPVVGINHVPSSLNELKKSPTFAIRENMFSASAFYCNE